MIKLLKNNCNLVGKFLSLLEMGKGESVLQKSNLTSVRFDFQSSTDAIWVFRETCGPVKAGRKGC